MKAATAIFSVVNGVLLRPLPYPDPDRLVVVWQNDRNTGTVREPASPADFFDFQDRARSFSGLAMHTRASVALTRSDGEPRRLAAAFVSHEMDDVLGVLPPDLEYPDPDVDLWLPFRETLAGAVRQAVWDGDPEVAFFGLATMEGTLREATARERFASVLVGIFAGLAVLLAVMGVGGVLSYLVARRGREVGVRMALRATRGTVVWMVLRQGLEMTAVGLVVGVRGYSAP